MDALTQDRADTVTLTFGAGDGMQDRLIEGFWLPDPKYRWMVGHRASLRLPTLLPGPLLLEVEAHPFVHDTHPAQRLLVRLDGVVVGTHRATTRDVLGFVIEGPGDHEPVLTFDMPDAAQPSKVSGSHDDRPLGFALLSVRVSRWDSGPPRPIAPSDEPLERFESIGDNCEFGIVQRAVGLEPLGLLRFTGGPLPFLLLALREQFARLTEPGAVTLIAEPQEYAAAVPVYGMYSHTFIPTDQPCDVVLARYVPTVAFLARKLLEDLAAAEKIFVYRQTEYLHLAEILPLFAALKRIGPVTLLIARPCDEAHPAGMVEMLMPGLLAGYFAEFTLYGNPHVTAEILNGWWVVCAEALGMSLLSRLAEST